MVSSSEDRVSGVGVWAVRGFMLKRSRAETCTAIGIIMSFRLYGFEVRALGFRVEAGAPVHAPKRAEATSKAPTTTSTLHVHVSLKRRLSSL